MPAIDITNLKKCISTLQESLNAYQTINDTQIKKFIEDSCIKRFEDTVETAWKLMKRYLKTVYGKTDKELTMNNIFRLMEGYGFIKSWESWREYYEKRNDTSLEYNIDKSLKIVDILPNFLQDVSFLYKELDKELNK